MSKRISFKLRGNEEKLALALQQQLYAEGTPLSLDTIVERMFVNWMYSNLAGQNEPTQTRDNAVGDITEVSSTDVSNALQVTEQGTGT